MKRIPVIIDTDIGTDIDDTWAVLMALNSPELDIKLIVSSTGDTILRAALLAKFLDRCGRTDIPIGIGIPLGSQRTLPERMDWRLLDRALSGQDFGRRCWRHH